MDTTNDLPFTDLPTYEEWYAEYGHLEEWLDISQSIDDYVDKQYHCEHEHKRRVKYTHSNNTEHHGIECPLCGYFEPTKKEGEANATRNKELRYKWDARKRKLSHYLKDRAYAKDRAKRVGAYQDFLNTDRWKQKRTLVLKRDNNLCQACLRRRATQVHHLGYNHEWGNEPLWTLKSVCNICHDAIHGVQDND